jgi:hypothetical protein
MAAVGYALVLVRLALLVLQLLLLALLVLLSLSLLLLLLLAFRDRAWPGHAWSLGYCYLSYKQAQTLAMICEPAPQLRRKQ